MMTYSIETLRADQYEMNKHLKQHAKTMGHAFVQFQMRACHPKAFECLSNHRLG
jgi:hypothetical protein